MKAIMLMFDSLNRHLLSPYGCDWTHTPNFRRLAERTVTFDRCYAGSLPCMPARRELHTGRYNFLHRSWGPLEPFDDSMPEILQNHGVYTHLISDHDHYWEDGGGTYHPRYSSWEIVRGQEDDKWKGIVKKPDIPEHRGQFGIHHFKNLPYMEREEDQPLANIFRLGFEFLDNNREEDNWFLQLECFDPHEPYHVPQKYLDIYPHEYDGPLFDWPPYRKVLPEEEEAVEHVRCQQAALLTMCDDYLGRLLDYMDTHDMWKDTMLMVNTDHGFLLGEHGCWAKCCHPFFEEVSHTPLFLWDPRFGVQNERRSALVQTIDLAPTLLDFFGVPVPADMQGVPLVDVVKEDKKIREAALFGIFGGQVNITDGRYVYMRGFDESKDLFEYTHMPCHVGRFSPEEMQSMTAAPPFSFTKGAPVMKIRGNCRMFIGDVLPDPYQTALYDLENDPAQESPIADEQVEERLIAEMIRLMQETDAPQEQYDRLRLTKLK